MMSNANFKVEYTDILEMPTSMDKQCLINRVTGKVVRFFRDVNNVVIIDNDISYLFNNTNDINKKYKYANFYKLVNTKKDTTENLYDLYDLMYQKYPSLRTNVNYTDSMKSLADFKVYLACDCDIKLELLFNENYETTLHFDLSLTTDFDVLITVYTTYHENNQWQKNIINSFYIDKENIPVTYCKSKQEYKKSKFTVTDLVTKFLDKKEIK